MRAMSGASRGFLAIVGASGLAQVIALVGTPVISRLFPPAEYGPFAVVNAAVLPAAALASLRFEMAVPVPEDERSARVLVGVGLRSSAIFGAAGTVLALLVGWLLPNVWRDHVTLLLWVPIVAGLMGAFAVLNQFAVRHRAYTAIARRNVLMAGTVVVLQVLAGLLDTGPHGLAAGLAGGQAVGVASLAHSLRPYLRTAPVEAPERKRIWRDFRSFPLLLAPSGVVNVLGVSAPLLLAASFYGEEVSGWLGMTQRVLTLPVTLIGLAIAQVYVGEFSRAKRGSALGLERMFLRTSARLGLAAVITTAVVATASHFAFPLVLGEAWTRSGQYAVLLAAAMGAQLCASPLSQTVIVLGRPGLQAAWDVSRLLACSGAIILGHGLGWGDLATVGLLSGTMVVTYGMSWCLSWWAVRRGPTGVSVSAASPASV